MAGGEAPPPPQDARSWRGQGPRSAGPNGSPTLRRATPSLLMQVAVPRVPALSLALVWDQCRPIPIIGIRFRTFLPLSDGLGRNPAGGGGVQGDSRQGAC